MVGLGSQAICTRNLSLHLSSAGYCSIACTSTSTLTVCRGGIRAAFGRTQYRRGAVVFTLKHTSLSCGFVSMIVSAVCILSLTARRGADTHRAQARGGREAGARAQGVGDRCSAELRALAPARGGGTRSRSGTATQTPRCMPVGRQAAYFRTAASTAPPQAGAGWPSPYCGLASTAAIALARLDLFSSGGASRPARPMQY